MNIKKRERETLRNKFNFMRSIIIKNQEISETEFILILDDHGIDISTYNKIKKHFRINSKKVGIHYNEKEELYHVGAKVLSLSLLTSEQKEAGK